jgi:hypothetical protein
MVLQYMCKTKKQRINNDLYITFVLGVSNESLRADQAIYWDSSVSLTIYEKSLQIKHA